jgi:hypothetical protein
MTYERGSRQRDFFQGAAFPFHRSDHPGGADPYFVDLLSCAIRKWRSRHTKSLFAIESTPDPEQFMATKGSSSQRKTSELFFNPERPIDEGYTKYCQS